MLELFVRNDTRRFNLNKCGFRETQPFGSRFLSIWRPKPSNKHISNITYFLSSRFSCLSLLIHQYRISKITSRCGEYRFSLQSSQVQFNAIKFNTIQSNQTNHFNEINLHVLFTMYNRKCHHVVVVGTSNQQKSLYQNDDLYTVLIL